MDRFDRISIGAVFVLVLCSGALIYGHRGDLKSDRSTLQRLQAAVPAASNGALDNGVRLARNLIEAGNLSQAETLLRDLKKTYPYQGELSMLMGDLLMRRQDPVGAMHEYKEAIELNPDYLDKKTPLFQGKKLKIAVNEAKTEIENRLRQDPENGSLRQEKKTIYYLYRRIAGSCG